MADSKRFKIYTKTGDEGETSLVGGQRVRKDHLRLEAYGTVDELNAVLGVVSSRVHLTGNEANMKQDCQKIEAWLELIQNELFSIGSQLACEDEKLRLSLPNIRAGQIERLEHQIDECTQVLPELKNFILPKGSEDSALFHLARTVCRRAERKAVALKAETELATAQETLTLVVRYLNRLSDWLFVLARYTNFRQGQPEIKWQKT